MTELATGATRARDRLPALDILRGIAIFGILFVNILIMGSVPGVERDPRLAGWGPLDQALWWLQAVLVEGTMRGLLSLLFGAGFILMMERGVDAARYYRRTLLLVLLGLVHGYLLLWPGDILLIYGLCGLLLWPLRHLEPRQMIGAGIAGLVFLSGLGLGANAGAANMRALAEGAMARGAGPEDARVADWKAYLDDIRPDPDAIDEARAARAGSLLDNWQHKVGVANRLNDPRMSRIWLVDALALMLIGGGLMKLGVLAGTAAAPLYRRLALAGYGLGIPINLLEWGQLAASDFAHPVPVIYWTDQPGRTLVTLGHVGLVLWLWRSGRGQRLLRLFAAPGRLALSNYIGQTLICQWLLFPGFALGLHARLSIAQLLGLALLIILAQLALSHLWLRRFRMGPLEWLWRWGSYGRRPRLLR